VRRSELSVVSHPEDDVCRARGLLIGQRVNDKETSSTPVPWYAYLVAVGLRQEA
jgi:hypothetical protein